MVPKDIWPSSSPDLNVCDYWLFGVIEGNPANIACLGRIWDNVVPLGLWDHKVVPTLRPMMWSQIIGKRDVSQCLIINVVPIIGKKIFSQTWIIIAVPYIKYCEAMFVPSVSQLFFNMQFNFLYEKN